MNAMSAANSPSAKRRAPAGDVVRKLPFVRDDAALVVGLRAGEAWARAALFDRYAPVVERILRRILGHDRRVDFADLIHDAFVQALASIDALRDAEALPAWMQTIAARTAYRAIRARRLRRWLCFWEPNEIPEIVDPGIDPDVLEAHQRTYAILDALPAALRVAFALRHIEGMELEQVAEILSVSRSTAKRRIARAEQRFARAAERDPALRPWLVEGGRWTT